VKRVMRGRRTMLDLMPGILLNLMLGGALAAVTLIEDLGAGSSVMMVWWW
jgi:hypothetical protein